MSVLFGREPGNIPDGWLLHQLGSHREDDLEESPQTTTKNVSYKWEINLWSHWDLEDVTTAQTSLI